MSPRLSALAGATLFLKHEYQQVTGATVDARLQAHDAEEFLVDLAPEADRGWGGGVDERGLRRVRGA